MAVKKVWKLFNVETGVKSDIDLSVLTIRQWLAVNFLGFGFYEVQQVNKDSYVVYDTFGLNLAYHVIRE